MTTPSSSGDLTVTVVDQPNLYASCLCTALELEGYDTELVPPEQAAAPVADLAGPATACRVAVVDLDPLGSSSLSLLRRLAGEGFHVLVVTTSVDPLVWAQCLACGVEVVLAKSPRMTEVVHAVRRVRDGLPPMSEDHRASLLAHRRNSVAQHRALAERFARLDRAEWLVLAHLVRGQALDEIEALPEIPWGTAGRHARSMLEKLEVNTWLDAIALANECDVHPPDVRG